MVMKAELAKGAENNDRLKTEIEETAGQNLELKMAMESLMNRVEE